MLDPTPLASHWSLRSLRGLCNPRDNRIVYYRCYGSPDAV